MSGQYVDIFPGPDPSRQRFGEFTLRIAAIEQLKTLAPELGWTELKLKSTPTFSSVVSLTWNRLSRSGSKMMPGYKSTQNLRRVFRIARLLHRRHEFFKVLRVVELIGYYMRYLEVFESGEFSLAVMSSHSNPHAIAFNLAARRFGVPTVMITHGMSGSLPRYQTSVEAMTLSNGRWSVQI